MFSFSYFLNAAMEFISIQNVSRTHALNGNNFFGAGKTSHSVIAEWKAMRRRKNSTKPLFLTQSFRAFGPVCISFNADFVMRVSRLKFECICVMMVLNFEISATKGKEPKNVRLM